MGERSHSREATDAISSSVGRAYRLFAAAS